VENRSSFVLSISLEKLSGKKKKIECGVFRISCEKKGGNKKERNRVEVRGQEEKGVRESNSGSYKQTNTSAFEKKVRRQKQKNPT